MLCSSRWVIPGLAAGVTGWPVDQRVPTAAGLRTASRRACRCDSARSGVQARRPKPLDAGPFAPEIGSFRLHLAAEGKAPKTVRTYTEAVAWFTSSHLIPRTSHTQREQVSGHDVQRWLVHLLTLYCDAYANN